MRALDGIGGRRRGGEIIDPVADRNVHCKSH